MDIYAEITNRIISEMEQGQIPWEKPWLATGSAISHTTGKAYSILNQLLLGKAGEYLTFKQVNAEGGYVRKGEKARMVVFWKWIDKEDEETGEIIQVPYLRYYNVFHIDQCEGITAKHQQEMPNSAKADETAESIITGYTAREGITLEHIAGDSAYYNPLADRIVLPQMNQFRETAEYYSTAYHEMIHSTGHAKRLNRLDATAFFGSESYSKEELVAEIGSAFLLHRTGLENAGSFKNNTAYIQNWLTALKNDKRFIVSAAGKADKAVEYILAGA